MALGAVTLGEVYAVLLFGSGRSVAGAVRAGLDDVHDLAVLVRIAADIIRVVTHQYPPHRINAYVEFYFCQFSGSRIKRIKRIAMDSFHLPLYIVVILLQPLGAQLNVQDLGLQPVGKFLVCLKFRLL